MITRRQFAALALPLLAAPSRRTTVAQGTGEKLPVVATFSIDADWTRNVGGDAIAVVAIVPTGGDAHTFDPDPSVITALATADVIVAIGPAFEPWLDDVVANAETDATVLHLADHVDLLDAPEGETDDHGDVENLLHPERSRGISVRANQEDERDVDPHIWGDVQNVITSVEAIRDALAEAAADQAGVIKAQADAYAKELGELDAWIRNQVATIPEERRKLVTSHDTFAYYAHAYGFEIIGTALGSTSTEGGDPSAKDIAELVNTIKESGVPAIFAENVVNPDLMQSIADEAGVRLAPPLYTDALGEPGTDGDTYIRMMQYNTTTIVQALTARG